MDEQQWLRDAFIELREAWFERVIKNQCAPGDWESEEEESQRNRFNATLKKKYDRQTFRIIAGDVLSVAPYTINSLQIEREKSVEDL